jgi:uncharacterized protein (TIGR03086 family)
MEPIDALAIALDNTSRIIAGVRDDQWEAGTPCEKWDVRALTNHTTWVVQMFGAVLQHADPPPRDADVVGDAPAAAFARAAATTLAAWRARPALDGTLQLPVGEMPASMAVNINLVDVHTHGWDIATATGQDPALDPNVSELALAFTAELLPMVGRRDSFAEPVGLAADAPVDARLVAYLGRQP